MARISQPLEQAKLKGADKKNPQRYRGESVKSAIPMGEQPPEHLGKKAKECWFQLRSLAIDGVLTDADSIELEIGAVLLAEFRIRPHKMSVARIAQLRSVLAKFGMNPFDRQRIQKDGGKEKSTNPFADLN